MGKNHSHHGHCDHDHGDKHNDDHSADHSASPGEGSAQAKSHSHVHGHSHGPGGHHHHGAVNNIKMAFFLNLFFSVFEIIGGLWVGSLAIVADAIHDFGDSISLGVAWFLEGYANKTRDDRFNFGYRRFSLLSALISGIVITAGSAVIINEAIRRFSEPHVPSGLPMMIFAVFGIAVNGAAAWRVSHGSTQNEKMLTWHLIEDIAGWGLVLVGGGVIYFTGWTWVDPVLALALAVFVSFNVIKHLKETAYLFLQGRPGNFDEDKFLSEASKAPGVELIDHLAVWSLDGETSVLSARLHLHSCSDPLEIERAKAWVKAAASRQNARATIETCLHESASHDKDPLS
jgi:cobalt-zinc-cadmium efflux system protein